MDAWLKRRGPSKNNLLVIDALAQEVNGITEEDEEYDGVGLELGSGARTKSGRFQVWKK